MRALQTFTRVFLITSAIVLAAGTVHAQWLGEWNYRHEVTIANPCAEELVDHQVLVRLDVTFDFVNAAVDGADLRATTADGETLLPHWLENWDPVGQTAAVWIQLPLVPAGGTTAYLYYGFAGAVDVADAGAVFAEYDGFETVETGNPGEWSRHPNNPVLVEGPAGAWDDHGATFASVIWDDVAGEFRMYYHGFSGSVHQVGLATSPDGVNWTKYAGNPIMTPTAGAWDSGSVRVPMVWKEGTAYHMIYTGYGSGGFQVGYATSTDGIAWTKHAANPVFNDPVWATGETENWGVMKVGTEYLMWYSDFGVRRSGIAVSTDLINWTPHQPNPIFDTSGVASDDRYSQFCPASFTYGGDFYVLVPSYDSGANYSSFYLYRSPSPFFPEADREIVRVAHTVGPAGAWDSHDSDTPHVLTLDIERSQFYNDELWCYYAAEGGANLWKVGLHVETDIAAALSTAPLPDEGNSWAITGDVTVVSEPVRHGTAAMRMNDTSASGGANFVGDFTAQATGVIGGWLRRDATTNGDVDIYLYGNGGATLSAVGGLGRNGDFHCWNGSFLSAGVNWAIDTWYLVTLVFDADVDAYDFVIYDASVTEIARVDDVAFGNAAGAIDRIMFYTSSGFVGQGFVDDFRLAPWCGAELGAVLGEVEVGDPVATAVQRYDVFVEDSCVVLSWQLWYEFANVPLCVTRAQGNETEYREIVGQDIVWQDASCVFRDETVQPGLTYRYRVEAVDGGVLCEMPPVTVPAVELALHQNNPNPFNPSTTIQYRLPESLVVDLAVYDLSGRLVAQLVDGEHQLGGPHTVVWNGKDATGRDAPSGMYVYRLRTDLRTVAKKMLMLR